MVEEFISNDDKIREELRRQYIIELGDVVMTTELEEWLEEQIELNLFLTKEAVNTNYSKHFENKIG